MFDSHAISSSDKIQYIYQQLVEINWIDLLTDRGILKCCAEFCKGELF